MSAVALALPTHFFYLPLWETIDFLSWSYLYDGNQHCSADIFPTWVLSTELTLFLADATARTSVITVSCTIDMDPCILGDGVGNRWFQIELGINSFSLNRWTKIHEKFNFSDADLTIITNSVTNIALFQLIRLYSADPWFAPSQWETSLQSNACLSLAGHKPRISPVNSPD